MGGFKDGTASRNVILSWWIFHKNASFFTLSIYWTGGELPTRKSISSTCNEDKGNWRNKVVMQRLAWSEIYVVCARENLKCQFMSYSSSFVTISSHSFPPISSLLLLLFIFIVVVVVVVVAGVGVGVVVGVGVASRRVVVVVVRCDSNFQKM